MPLLVQLSVLMNFVVAKWELGSEFGHRCWSCWINLHYTQEKEWQFKRMWECGDEWRQGRQQDRENQHLRGALADEKRPAVRDVRRTCSVRKSNNHLHFFDVQSFSPTFIKVG